VQPPVAKAEAEPTAVSLKEFTRHLQLAERYFERREYRHAAETFALAAAYRPTDPRPHLGRSHALLATGQYDASAMALAKAMELDARVVLKKTDLIQAVGGPDAFIARFNVLDETAQAGDAPMLQFLLAYIYYQMDRLQEARTASEIAQRLLPSSVPIDLLKTALFR
jgi:tetratricopeptide (TPR) repeat protein